MLFFWLMSGLYITHKEGGKMLNIANVDESLKMYIRKELLVDDFLN